MDGVRKVNEWITMPGRSLIVNDANVDMSKVPDGTLYIHPTTGVLKIKVAGTQAWIDMPPASIMREGVVTNTYIAPGTIQSDRIGANQIITSLIADSQITNAKIAAGTIDYDRLKADSIRTVHIKDRELTNSKYALASITTDIIADASITFPKLSVNSVNTVNIINNAVSTDKILNASVTRDKIATDSIYREKIKDAEVIRSKIALLAINEDLLAADSVRSIHIKNLEVTKAKLETSVQTDITNAVKFNPDPNVLLATIAGNLYVTKVASLNSIYVSTTSTFHETATFDGTLNVLGTTGITCSNGAVACKTLTTSSTAAIGTATPAPGAMLTVSGIISATGDITTTGGKVYMAVYNDFAEAFEPAYDAKDFEPGTIVEITCNKTVCHASTLTTGVVGVISDCYAQLLGGTREEIESGKKVPVGVLGKIPVLIKGQARIGNLVVSDGKGIGMATTGSKQGTIVGKVLEDKLSNDIQRVLCLVYLA